MRPLLVATLAACGGGRSVRPAEATATEPTMGDVNADGFVDLADASYLVRHRLEGGPAPACRAAADIVDDGGDRIDPGDAYALVSWLFVGTGLPTLEAGACDDWEPPVEEVDCASLAVDIEAPRRSGGAFDATVQLTSRDDPGPHGWSLSIAATGCRVGDASIAGTVAAHITDSPPGLRDTGFARAVLTDDGGAVSAAMLDWLRDARLPGSKEPADVLVLHVEPGSGCDCTLALVDGGVGEGQPVDNIVVRDGRRFPLDPVEVRVDVCGG